MLISQKQITRKKRSPISQVSPFLFSVQIDKIAVMTKLIRHGVSDSWMILDWRGVMKCFMAIMKSTTSMQWLRAKHILWPIAPLAGGQLIWVTEK